MPNIKLTETTVRDAAPVAGKKMFVWDSSLKGFGLLVSPGGKKAFVLQYRPAGSRQDRRMKIGDPAYLKVADARTKAKTLLGEVAQGKDPAAEKQAVKAETTVSGLMTRFLTEHVATHNKPSTARRVKCLIEVHIAGRKGQPDPKDNIPESALGKLRLSELTGPKVKAWHKGIKSNVSANRAFAALSRACVMAKEWGWISQNPCAGITKNPEKRIDRSFSDEELSRIGQALRELEAEGVILPTVALGIRLLALTGLRPGEIRLARWSDYSRELQRLRLPDSKTGPRAVRLSPEAVALLDGAARIGPYIAAGNNPDKPMDDDRLCDLVKRVLTRAKVTDGHPHVFRHTFATCAAESGATAPEIMAACGWSTMAMAQRYISMHGMGGIRHPLPPAARIAAALAGTLPPASDHLP